MILRLVSQETVRMELSLNQMWKQKQFRIFFLFERQRRRREEVFFRHSNGISKKVVLGAGDTV